MANRLVDWIIRPRRLRRVARRELTKLVGGEAADVILFQAETKYRQIAATAPKSGLGAQHLLRMSSYSIALADDGLPG